MGHTALHWAARGGHLDAARWLVSHGGLDATCRSKDGATALDVALGLRNAEVAGFLKEVGRDTKVTVTLSMKIKLMKCIQRK